MNDILFLKTIKDVIDITREQDLLPDFNDIKRQIEKLEKVKLSAESFIAGEKIDLIRFNYDEFLQYYIFKHGRKEEIGYIEYRGQFYDRKVGDIGFFVHESYRGNNYAYYALELLSSILYENNIESFWISANIWNLPSIKTIEKFNGKRVDIIDNIYLYQCETKRTLKKVLR